MNTVPVTLILVAIMSSRENTGMALGLLGVVIFSLTLPFTRVVVQELHPLLNGLGRAPVSYTHLTLPTKRIV